MTNEESKPVYELPEALLNDLRMGGTLDILDKDGNIKDHYEFSRAEKEAAYELHVQLRTRITAVPLPDDRGDEQEAITSIYLLFSKIRDILCDHGMDCLVFADRVAIPVMNQVLRTFLLKWHKNHMLSKPIGKKAFRADLRELQNTMNTYDELLLWIVKSKY